MHLKKTNNFQVQQNVPRPSEFLCGENIMTTIHIINGIILFKVEEINVVV